MLMTRCFSTCGLARQNQQGPDGCAATSKAQNLTIQLHVQHYGGGFCGLTVSRLPVLLLTVASSILPVRRSLPAAPACVPVLLPTQVEEKLLRGFLDDRRRDVHMWRKYVTPVRVSTDLLFLGAEGWLLSFLLVFCWTPVGVLRHVLRLLHQLCGIHVLHRDDVEGIKILRTGS